VSFVRQALDRLPEGVPALGKTIGFVINYSPDKAVRFDRNGQPIAILDKAVRPRTAVLRLGCEFRFNPAGYSDLMPATIPI
jgi:hypothetical protein